MEEVRGFTKGLNKDINPLNLPEDTYVAALNWVQVSRDGNIWGITNEQGTVDKQVSFPTGFQVIGATVLNSDIIVFLVHSLGYSQIGVVSESSNIFTYARCIPSPGMVGGDTNSELGLSINFPVDATARKRFTGERMVYFAAQNRPMGVANLDANIDAGEIYDNTKLIPNQNIPNIDFLGFDETSGRLQIGVYQFVTSYVNASLNSTSYGIPSNVIPVIENRRAEGRNNYDGEYPDYGFTSKTIQLQFSNLDTSYPYLKVVVIRYNTITNTFNAASLPLINITGETMQFSYNGNETARIELTREELRVISISYDTAKAVTQKDSVAFWSNLTDSSSTIDEDLQRLANKIEVQYKIKEIPYVDGAVTAPTFGVFGDPYILNPASMTGDEKKIVIDFTNDVDTITGAVLANYSLKDAGTQATGAITITNFANLLETTPDAVVVNGTTFTAQAGVVTPGTGTFRAATSVGDTGDSLAAQINAHATTSLIVYASSDGLGVITLTSILTGVVGNAYTLVYNQNGAAVGATISGATLTGGVNQVTYVPTAAVVATTTVTLTFIPVIGGNWTLQITGVKDITTSFTYSSAGYIKVNTTQTSPDITTITGNFTDYKNEGLTFYEKGYRRDEVYSLALVVNFKDGGQSPAYHIPGNLKLPNPGANNFTPAIPDPSIPSYTTPGRFGKLGTYFSTIDYPLNQTYPGNLAGDDLSLSSSDRKIRHHKMPSLIQEPHFRYDSGTQATYIRILGLQMKFNQAIPNSIRSKIQSITLVRQRRETDANTSVYAQGLVDRYVKVARGYDYSTGVGSNYAYKKMPFFNNTIIYNPSFTLSTIPFALVKSIAFESTNNDRRLAFFSPDTQLGNLNSTTIKGAGILKPVLRLSSSIDYSKFTRSEQWVQNAGVWGKSYLHYFLVGWLFANYYKEDTTLTGGGQTALITGADYVAKLTEVTLSGWDAPIDNVSTSRHLVLETLSTAPIVAAGTNTTVTVGFRVNESLAPAAHRNDDTLTYDKVDGTKNHLMNIEVINNTQYGNIGGSEFIPITTVPVTATTLNTVGAILPNIFGGDTFITKFAYQNSDIYYYAGLTFEIASLIEIGHGYSTSIGAGGGATSQEGAIQKGMDLRSLSYFFVESNINTAYRHVYADRSTSTPVYESSYYPKTSADATLSQQVQTGDSEGYNTQYSFENNVKTYNTKTAQNINVTKFETRTIYSDSQAEDAVDDAYKKYPQNNYYDLPKHTGEIWDNFVHANILYLHTPKSLWRTFVNDVNIQSSSIGAAVLGTTQIFQLPAKEMITTNGGYAGSISQFGGVLTPFGYVFPDTLQGKMFMLTGESLTEISVKGMQQYFNNTMASGLVNGNVFSDNPYTGNGFCGVYDFDLKRIVITKKTSSGVSFTYSYSIITDSWVCEHSYLPHQYIALNNRMFSMNNASTVTFNEHNVGIFGQFFGTTFQSYIDVIFNKAPAIEKTFDNFVIHSQSKDIATNALIHLDTFNTMQVQASVRNTGTITLIPTQALAPILTPSQRAVRRVKNKYQVAIPGNAVINDALDITQVGNLNQASLYKPRMKGDHIITRFVYNNVNNYKFLLNFIAALFRANPK